MAERALDAGKGMLLLRCDGLMTWNVVAYGAEDADVMRRRSATGRRRGHRLPSAAQKEVALKSSRVMKHQADE